MQRSRASDNDTTPSHGRAEIRNVPDEWAQKSVRTMEEMVLDKIARTSRCCRKLSKCWGRAESENESKDVHEKTMFQNWVDIPQRGRICTLGPYHRRQQTRSKHMCMM